MARPIKDGLSYFSHDTNSAEDKLKYVFSECKVTDSYSIYFMILELIYAINGYYIVWNDREENIFISDKLKKELSKEQFINILNVLLKEKLFNIDLFNKYKILTSAGIQKRFLAGSIRKTEIKFIKEYLLIDVSNKKYDSLKSRFIINDISGNKISITKVKKDIKVFDFEKLWKMYPRQEGKKNAMTIFDERITTLQDYEDLQKAIINYKNICDIDNIERKYIKTGRTFFEYYEDYINIEVQVPDNKKSIYKNAKDVLKNRKVKDVTEKQSA